MVRILITWLITYVVSKDHYTLSHSGYRWPIIGTTCDPFACANAAGGSVRECEMPFRSSRRFRVLAPYEPIWSSNQLSVADSHNIREGTRKWRRVTKGKWEKGEARAPHGPRLQPRGLDRTCQFWPPLG